MEFNHVPLTHNLANTGRFGIPVWHRVAKFCAVELLPLDGWKAEYHAHAGTAHVRLLRWGRGADVTLVVSADGTDVIRIFAEPCSTIASVGASIFSCIVALPVFVLMLIDRQGSLAALLAAVVAFLAGFCVAWPVTAIVGRLFRTSEESLRQLSAFFCAALTDEARVAEMAADDIEEEDFNMDGEDLQRKYGYSKGNQIYRQIHREEDTSE